MAAALESQGLDLTRELGHAWAVGGACKKSGEPLD
jgi:hypothetical protein